MSWSKSKNNKKERRNALFYIIRQCAEINFTNSAGFLTQCKETTTTRTGGALGGVDAAMRQKDKEDVKFISKHCLERKT